MSLAWLLGFLSCFLNLCLDFGLVDWYFGLGYHAFGLVSRLWIWYFCWLALCCTLLYWNFEGGYLQANWMWRGNDIRGWWRLNKALKFSLSLCVCVVWNRTHTCMNKAPCSKSKEYNIYAHMTCDAKINKPTYALTWQLGLQTRMATFSKPCWTTKKPNSTLA